MPSRVAVADRSLALRRWRSRSSLLLTQHYVDRGRVLSVLAAARALARRGTPRSRSESDGDDRRVTPSPGRHAHANGLVGDGGASSRPRRRSSGRSSARTSTSASRPRSGRRPAIPEPHRRCRRSLLDRRPRRDERADARRVARGCEARRVRRAVGARRRARRAGRATSCCSCTTTSSRPRRLPPSDSAYGVDLRHAPRRRPRARRRRAAARRLAAAQLARGLTRYRAVGVQATAFYWHFVNTLAIAVLAVQLSPRL